MGAENSPLGKPRNGYTRLMENLSKCNHAKDGRVWMKISGSKTRICFIPIAFQVFFRIFHQEGQRKSGRIGTEWNTSTPGQCGLCYIRVGWNHK